MTEKEDRAQRLINTVPTVIMHMMYMVIAVSLYVGDSPLVAFNFSIQIYLTSIVVITLYKKHIVKGLIRNTDVEKKKYVIRLIVLVLAGMLIVSIIDLLNISGKPPLILNVLLWLIFTLVGLFLASTSAYTHYYYGQKLNTVKAEADKVKAELGLLKSQINPHFLFNTLNNIYGLVHMKDKRAPEMISQLSQILRYLLYDCSAPRVSLRKERELIENYLRLQSMKSKSLVDRIDFYCDGIADKHTIMPMLLINFVENCFKHSDIETNEEGWVTVTLEISNNELHFTTRNTIKKDVKKKKDSGIGLFNTQKMLSAEYGEKHSLQAGMIDDFFEIGLKLQLV
ncbi:sensor histidine kinase [Roseivirga sp. E12]|uniref:sensor histidine kinase n=1 Tax=Roseivirga sp. E12 TaxID=2819237 RepID=UPI00351C3093